MKNPKRRNTGSNKPTANLRQLMLARALTEVSVIVGKAFDNQPLTSAEADRLRPKNMLGYDFASVRDGRVIDDLMDIIGLLKERLLGSMPMLVREDNALKRALGVYIYVMMLIDLNEIRFRKLSEMYGNLLVEHEWTTESVKLLATASDALYKLCSKRESGARGRGAEKIATGTTKKLTRKAKQVKKQLKAMPPLDFEEGVLHDFVVTFRSK